MNEQGKKQAIKKLVVEMLKESQEEMIEKIDTIIESGAVDVENWNENFNKMVIPKTIVTALLENESKQRDGRGTSFEKQVKRDVKDICNFL